MTSQKRLNIIKNVKIHHKILGNKSRSVKNQKKFKFI